MKETISLLELTRIRQAVGLQGSNLRAKNDPVNHTVEMMLSDISNKLRRVAQEAELSGSVTLFISGK